MHSREGRPGDQAPPRGGRRPGSRWVVPPRLVALGMVIVLAVPVASGAQELHRSTPAPSWGSLYEVVERAHAQAMAMQYIVAEHRAVSVIDQAALIGHQAGSIGHQAGFVAHQAGLMAHQTALAALQEQGSGFPSMSGAEPHTVPAPWLDQDPADSLYRAARSALNRGEHAAAARDFQRIRERFPSSGYVGDSYYYQAFALSRGSDQAGLRQAIQLLDTQARSHASAATRRDADALRVRVRASLAARGDAGAAQQIRETVGQTPCGGPEQETRMMALGALLNMDSQRALPILREVLSSRDACSVELRRRAVFLVAQQDDPGTVDILLDLAHRNPDPDLEVRRQAVFWLSEVDGEESLEALEAILETSQDAEIQERAIFALSQHDSPRATTLLGEYARRTDAPDRLRERAIFWIGETDGGGAAIRSLYPTLGSDALKEQALFAASEASDDDPSMRDWLLERARDRGESLEVRKKAIFWAGESGLSSAELRSLYDSADETEIREQLIFALSESDDEGAVEALIGIAREETDPELRKRAIFWLGQHDDPRAAEYLLELVRTGGGR